MENSRSKIIMVDDNITNLTVAKNLLADTYNFFTVPSGKKLFQILEKLTPDLILLDIEMPEMNGFETIEMLKSKENFSSIPVIFLTADNSSEKKEKGLSLGAVDYITKPFTKELLVKRMEVHLSVNKQKGELNNSSQNTEKSGL